MQACNSGGGLYSRRDEGSGVSLFHHDAFAALGARLVSAIPQRLPGDESLNNYWGMTGRVVKPLDGMVTGADVPRR